jgi:hypothetical protein
MLEHFFPKVLMSRLLEVIVSMSSFLTRRWGRSHVSSTGMAPLSRHMSLLSSSEVRVGLSYPSSINNTKTSNR